MGVSYLVSILIILSFSIPLIEAELAWWDTSWNYRQELTFDNCEQAENLIDFPVLVKLTSSNFDFSRAQSDGDDIRFIDENDVTELKFHWENYDSVAEEAHGWVKVPQINALSDTDFIYMYYGNKEASNVEDEEGTYDSNFVMVQHMSDETPTTIRDSTINDNDGIKWEASGPTEIIDGKIGYAQEFDGDNDHIIIPRSFDFDVLTVEAWIKRDTVDADHTIFGYGTALTYCGWSFLVGNDNYLRFVAVTYNGNINFDVPGSTTTIDSDKWYYVTAVCGGPDYGDDAIIYVNGGEEARSDQEKSMDWDPIRLILPKIGEWGTTQYQHRFDGIIDEVRVSDIARSPDWIKACYKSESDFFITFGHNTDLLYDEVWVDDDFTASTEGWEVTHWDEIQEGIDAVVDGGTVNVSPGTYYENIRVTKDDLTIQSVSGDPLDTIIDGSGIVKAAGGLVYVTGDGIVFSGFTVRESFYSAGGICIQPGSDNGIYENNIISENENTAFFILGDGNVIRNNVISNNRHSGNIGQINLQMYTDDNIIENNVISGNGKRQIMLWNAGNGNVIQYNTITGIGLVSYDDNYPIAIQLSDIGNDNIVRGNTIAPEEGGLGFTRAINIAGARFGGFNTLVEGNIIHNNIVGVKVGTEMDTTLVKGNDIQGNEFGIKVEKTAKNTIIEENDILSNNVGVIISTGSDLIAASTTHINHNNILDNVDYGVLNEIETSIDATLNWWGTTNPSEIEAMVSGDVTVYPWIEPTWHGKITDSVSKIVPANQKHYKVDARSMADTNVYVDTTTGTPVVIIAKYEDNPGVDLNGDGGTYADVYLSDISGVDKVEIRLYHVKNDWNPRARVGMYYLSGSEWKKCSTTGIVNGNDEEYVWTIITGSTTPSLNYLFGGPFGVGAEVSSQFDEVREVWGSMFQLIVIMASFALMSSLLSDEPGNGGTLRTIVPLVAGTAVLMILLWVVENIG